MEYTEASEVRALRLLLPEGLGKIEARVDKLRDPVRRDRAMEMLKTLRRGLEDADGLDVVFARHSPERMRVTI